MQENHSGWGKINPRESNNRSIMIPGQVSTMADYRLAANYSYFS
jgi:hypothetical protein